MSQENVDALKEGYDAFARGDIDAAFQNFADDITWRGTGDSVPGGGNYNGKDELKNQWMPEFAATYQDFRQNVDELIDAGDCVIALGTSRATVGGQEIKSSFCHVWKYSGDKITEASFYGDTAPAALALQGQEAKA